MAVRESPDKKFHAWQRVKALASTFSDKSTKAQARETVKNTALAAGSVVAGAVIYHSITFLLIPTLCFTAGLGAGGWFGWKAYGGIKALKTSNVFFRHMRAQEEKRLEKKSRPKMGARFQSLFRQKVKAKEAAPSFEQAAASQREPSERELKSAAARAEARRNFKNRQSL